MSRENDTYISIRAPKEFVRQLKLLCLSMSKQAGRVISMSQFIRETMSPFCHLEKQQDFTVKEKPKRLRRKI